MANYNSRVLALLVDQEWHTLEEIEELVLPMIAPEKAIRYVTSNYKDQEKRIETLGGLESAILAGRKRAIGIVLKNAIAKGFVEAVNERLYRMTDHGYQECFLKTGRNGARGRRGMANGTGARVWKELRCLVLEGKAKISLRPIKNNE